MTLKVLGGKAEVFEEGLALQSIGGEEHSLLLPKAVTEQRAGEEVDHRIPHRPLITVEGETTGGGIHSIHLLIRLQYPLPPHHTLRLIALLYLSILQLPLNAGLHECEYGV